MNHTFRTQFVGLMKASHFGPTVLVVAITFVLSITQLSFSEALFVSFAILLGQFVVGWTNDFVDFSKDAAAKRGQKPLVAGTINPKTLRISIFIALTSALFVSLMSPLGISGSAIHFIGLLSATAYNLKLKATVFSVLPYIVSFGALPWAIFSAAGSSPPSWLVFAFILFASAFHFLNVLKDLESDIGQDVLGLPQVFGRNKSIATATILAGLGVIVVVVSNFTIYFNLD